MLSTPAGSDEEVGDAPPSTTPGSGRSSGARCVRGLVSKAGLAEFDSLAPCHRISCYSWAMPKPNLPVVLVKDDRRLTASTPSEYVDLTYKGFVVDEDAEENLTPAQKAARTRAANRAQEAQDTSNVPAGATDPAGDANSDS